MKRKQIILARPGTFGSEGQEQTITEDDLREIADSYSPGDAVPVTVSLEGHPAGNFPKLGEVVNLFFDEETKTLKGDLQLHDTLAAAMDDGFYDNWSIGAKTKADTGKMYLHHVALLGEMPPAIKNLREKVMTTLSLSDLENDFIFKFSDFCRYNRINRLKEYERKRLIEASSGKITIPLQERLIQLADTLYTGDIMLCDSEGKSRQSSIYAELAEIFENTRLKVEPGVYNFEDKNKSTFNKKDILKKG